MNSWTQHVKVVWYRLFLFSIFKIHNNNNIILSVRNQNKENSDYFPTPQYRRPPRCRHRSSVPFSPSIPFPTPSNAVIGSPLSPSAYRHHPPSVSLPYSFSYRRVSSVPLPIVVGTSVPLSDHCVLLVLPTPTVVAGTPFPPLCDHLSYSS